MVTRLGSFIDLTNKKIGRWTVLYRNYERQNNDKHKRIFWHCKCDCGRENDVGANLLLSGSSKSCGCLNREKSSKASLIRHQQNRNTYNLTGEYGIGYTKKGEEFYFDLEDYDLIKDYNWFINDQHYVLARVNVGNSKIKIIRMHRIVMNELRNNIEIDHVHGKETRNDNRKSNLRIATHTQNSINKNVMKRNTSGVTGVNYYKKNR